MNKYQEALDTLKGYAQCNPDVSWVLIYESNLLQELVDKATPTEHKYLTDQECKKCGGNGLYLEDYEYDELTYIEGRDYCPNCGQKIDWTDID